MEAKTVGGGVSLEETFSDSTSSDRMGSNLHSPASAGSDEKHEANLQRNAVTEDPQLAVVAVPSSSVFKEVVTLSTEEHTIPMRNAQDSVKETSLSISGSSHIKPSIVEQEGIERQPESILEQDGMKRLPEAVYSAKTSDLQIENHHSSSDKMKKMENENKALPSQHDGHEESEGGLSRTSQVDDVSTTSGKLEVGISVGSADQQGNDNPVEAAMCTSPSQVEVLKNDCANGQLVDPSDSEKPASSYSGLVDTASPFESVKEAVTKFGGIVDWKAHKEQTLERRKQLQIELQKVQEEIPVLKKNLEVAEDGKVQVLKELDTIQRLVEELRLNLERAITEEAQAKQDSELALLRIQEIKEGIDGETSKAAKAQLELAKERHASAVIKLASTKEELEMVKVEYVSLIVERDIAIGNAEEAISVSRHLEKSVEDLTLELIASKELLESAQAAHLEAEEHRIGAALAREQDVLNWEKELKKAKEELQHLNEQIELTRDLKSKLDAASTLFLNLKVNLADYMEPKPNEGSESVVDDRSPGNRELKKTHSSVEASLISTRKEIDEVKIDIEKAKNTIDTLSVAASSLKTEVETENAALVSLRQMEGMASIAVSSLEAELERTKSEIERVLAKDKETREKMLELPKLLQKAAWEADQAKSDCASAHGELKKAMEEAELAKSSSRTIEIRLNAAMKEIEATKASERLALAAIKALQESEQAAAAENAEESGQVTLTLEDYYELSKKAHEAEELAIARVKTAIEQIRTAKESETKSLEALNEASEQLSQKEQQLRVALEKAEKAKEGKLGVEQELRKWRAEHEKRRKATDVSQVLSVSASDCPAASFEESRELKSFGAGAPDAAVHTTTQNLEVKPLPEVKVKKKLFFFPRILMFFSGKKAKKVK